MWVIVALGVLALSTFVVYRRWHPGGPSDLGWVTERWLAEHRAGQSGESRSR
jgi:hypothetical protein